MSRETPGSIRKEPIFDAHADALFGTGNLRAQFDERIVAPAEWALARNPDHPSIHRVPSLSDDYRLIFCQLQLLGYDPGEYEFPAVRILAQRIEDALWAFLDFDIIDANLESN